MEKARYDVTALSAGMNCVSLRADWVETVMPRVAM